MNQYLLQCAYEDQQKKFRQTQQVIEQTAKEMNINVDRMNQVAHNLFDKQQVKDEDMIILRQLFKNMHEQTMREDN